MKTTHRFAITALIAATMLVRSHSVDAAIDVGAGGTETFTFDSAPGSAEWTTIPLPGNDLTLLTFSDMEGAAQSLSAEAITNALGITATFPPGTSSAQGARWNSSAAFLQTRPAGAMQAVALLAVLRNSSGINLTSIAIQFEMAIYSPVSCELPGYWVYYSLSGATNEWHLLPELSHQATNATLRASVNLGSWTNGGPLYLLWLDDNCETSDPGCAIDNFAVTPTPRLEMGRAGDTGYEVSWPAPAVGYRLQWKEHLVAPDWENIAMTNAPVEGRHRVPINTSNTASYFRLERP